MTIKGKSLQLSTILLGVAAFAVIGAAWRSPKRLTLKRKARIARFEKGPGDSQCLQISVRQSSETTKCFSQKCSQCHKLSRPINSDYALPDEWSRYVHRMMSKPGSGIDAGVGKKIYDFLVYDSSVRKKAMVDAKLAKASPADKAAAEAKIKEVHDKYDH